MMQHRKRLCIAAVFMLLGALVFADATPFKGLTRHRLENGLELFVLENHSSPLVYIEIAFRCGGYAQNAETAGLFHLYEHMMFKGNARFKSAAEIQKACLDLGVASWNGSTGAEKVNYYFTIPSTKVREGLEFWAAAVRDASLDPEELKNEIGVVVSEITGKLSDPAWILQSAVDKTLFPRFPWRRDSGGSLENIRNCTVEKLTTIKNTFYVPGNAALFVGGDIKPEDALKLVREVYGSWEEAPDPWAGAQEPQAFPAVAKPVLLVYPDPKVSARYAITSIYMRGPDVDTQPAPTYAADVFGYFSGNPDGRFRQAIAGNAELGIPNANYMGGYYYTQRDGGQINFYAYMMTKSALGFAERGLKFADSVLNREIPAIIADPQYFSAQDYATVKTIMEDSQILDMETMDGFLKTLSFWWASASTDYFFGYVPAMKKVGPQEIARYLEDFITHNPPVIVVQINPAVYEEQKPDFARLGYQLIDSENAFWWKKK